MKSTLGRPPLSADAGEWIWKKWCQDVQEFMASGTYTPTIGTKVNITGTPTLHIIYYTRLGANVSVDGFIDIQPTAAAGTLTTVELSLPITSTVPTTYDVTGIINCGSSTDSGIVLGVAANATAKLFFLANNTFNLTYGFHFTYKVQ